MSFFQSIRNSVSGTTLFLQSKTENKLGFFTLYLLTFGIMQIIAFFIFYKVFGFVFREFFNFNPDSLFRDLETSQSQFYLSFVSIYLLIFLVTMIKHSGGLNATRLNFGALFQMIKLRVFLIYFVSFFVSLFALTYVINSLEYSFFGGAYGNPLYLPYSFDDSWYKTLFKNIALFVIRFAPYFVLGYYLISLREGNWKWSYISKYWKTVLALLSVLIMLKGVFLVVVDIAQRIFSSVLSQTFQNSTILIIILVAIYLLFTIFYHGIAGYLAYFSVFAPEKAEGSKRTEKPQEPNETDLLDQ